ncbi:MAG: biotin/lipoyl-binding protein [Fimbriimonadaceae bacterium]
MKRIWIGLFVLVVILGGIGMVAMNVMNAQKQMAAQLNKTKDRTTETVKKGDLTVTVIETGSLEAEKSVEVKSRVGGRVARLLVDEGDFVEKGELIAVIDPQETELQVAQNRAQLKGAQSDVRRLAIEIQQRRVTAQTNLSRAKSRLAQIQKELKAQPEQTSASIVSAESNLSGAKKGYDLLVNINQPNARTNAEVAVKDAANNLEKAKIAENRAKELYAKGYAAGREVESAELSRQLAETRLASVQDSLSRLDREQRLERERSLEQIKQAEADLSRAKLGRVSDETKQLEYERAKADVRDAEAALKDIQVLEESKIRTQSSVEQINSSYQDTLRQLGETEIRAPISGVVTRRLVQEGELVAALSAFSSGSTIVALENRDAMLVKLEINEIDVAKLRLGLNSEVSVDALPNEKFEGQITKIAPAQVIGAQGVAVSGVVKYEVEVLLENVSNQLKSGMSAKCTMKPIDKSNVMVVPISFVGKDKQGHYVLFTTEKEAKAAAEKQKQKAAGSERQVIW